MSKYKVVVPVSVLSDGNHGIVRFVWLVKTIEFDFLPRFGNCLSLIMSMKDSIFLYKKVTAISHDDGLIVLITEMEYLKEAEIPLIENDGWTVVTLPG